MSKHKIKIVEGSMYWDWNKTAKGFVVYFELENGRVHSKLIASEGHNLVDIFEEDGEIILIVE